MTRGAAALVLLLACASPGAQVQEPRTEAAAPWCVRLELRYDSRWQLGIACAETQRACLQVQRQALRWGGLARLRSVGVCKETP